MRVEIQRYVTKGTYLITLGSPGHPFAIIQTHGEGNVLKGKQYMARKE